MSEEFARNVLKVAMAQICQNLGWHAVQTSPMNILVDILQRYMSTLAKVTHQYAEHYNRIEPNLNDLALAFKEMGISLTDLEDYASNVESVPFVHQVPKFPAPHTNQYNFPKDNCREVNLRPEWIFPHLPCVYPDEDPPPSPIEASKESADSAFLSTDIPSPSGSPKPGTRRPFELIQDGNFPPSKRPRVLSDEEGRPVREVVSVSMTPTGLLSPYREGRLPDTCTPLKGFEDSRPSSPVVSEEAEESPPPSVAVVEPPPVLPLILPPEIIKVKKAKLKDGTKHKIKIKKENREKKKESKENKSKKKEMLKAQLKVKDKLTKLAKTKKLKNYKLPKSPKGVLDLSKHKKLGRPKKIKTLLPISKVKTETVHKSDVSPVKPKVVKPVKHVTKSPKPAKAGKSPKPDKAIAGGQLASLLAKASGSASIIKTEKFSPEKSVNERDSYSRSESFLRKSASPVHYNEPRNVENNSVPGSYSRDDMRDYEYHDHANSNSSSNLRSDSEEIPSFRSKIKLEPKDVYDFTDDEDNRNNGASDESRERDREHKVETIAPPTPARVEPAISQVPAEVFRPMLTSPPKKKRGRPPKNPKPESNLTPSPKSRTPEPFPRSPNLPSQQKSPFSSVSNFGMPPMSSQMPSMASQMNFYPLANIPPALLPFNFASGVNQPNMNMDLPVAGPSGITQYPKLVDLADVAISKAQHDGDFDLGRIKDKDKAKRDKKLKRDKKDKEKQKVKKKKDKTKEKNPEKNSSGKSDKNKDKLKSKKIKSSSEGKNKEKKDKSEKNKEKKKDKCKDKDKRLEKKKEKIPKVEKEFKEERERQRSPSPAPGVVFPRLTFKLGSGTESESPKIVIKGLSNTDSPSSSPLPYVSDRSPPGSPPHQRPTFGAVISGGSTSHGKAHVKTTPKVPVPPPPPARTVITETVGTIIDASGNKIWICPACTHPDDGSPMIGCDDCDEWYHWICVGIVVPPNDDENWFCSRCIAKQQTLLKKRRYRKDT